jgi:hypothetical protein
MQDLIKKLGFFGVLLLVNCSDQIDFFSGRILRDCATQTPLANEYLQLWNTSLNKEHGSCKTDDNGYFRMYYKRTYRQLILRRANTSHQLLENLLLIHGDNLHADICLAPEYYIRVHLEANPSTSITTVSYQNLITRDWQTLNAPFTSGLLYEGKVKYFKQSYPKSYDRLDFRTDDMARQIQITILSSCNDTVDCKLIVK